MPKKDPRVSQFIKNAAPFARPILVHLRRTVHTACPRAEETMKWGVPFFLYEGKILCGMATFKSHCKFFLWNWKRVQKSLGASAKAETSKLRHVEKIGDLPKASTLKAFLKEAMKLNEAGIGRAVRPGKKKPPVKTPADLLRALKGTPRALTHYEAFSPSAKRLYVEWITGAKTEETRERRLEQAVEAIAAGKKQYWK